MNILDVLGNTAKAYLAGAEVPTGLQAEAKDNGSRGSSPGGGNVDEDKADSMSVRSGVNRK